MFSFRSISVIRAISVLEGIALVGNPNFAIVDEAFPYIARRLMTDKSPRLRAALRYMIYGKEGSFNAENLIDLLEALEKFTAVRDEADGTAFKVDGVRGRKTLGQAGDFAGSQIVDTSERDTDIDGGRFRVSQPSSPNGSTGGTISLQTTNDERTVREALRFFFGPEGETFREFMLEEIVTAADAMSRDGLRVLARDLGLRNVPTPAFLQAMSPPLNDNDRKMVNQIEKLVGFLFGDFDTALDSARLRKLIPIVREYAPQLRDFGVLLVARLAEKNLSRGLRHATKQLNRADQRFSAGVQRLAQRGSLQSS